MVPVPTVRVKTTIYEQYKGSNVPHDYKVTKIELAISGSSTSDALTNSIETESSVSGAKLLNNIEKSYDKNVKLLDAGVMGTGTLVRYLSRISGTCPYDSCIFSVSSSGKSLLFVLP